MWVSLIPFCCSFSFFLRTTTPYDCIAGCQRLHLGLHPRHHPNGCGCAQSIWHECTSQLLVLHFRCGPHKPGRAKVAWRRLSSPACSFYPLTHTYFTSLSTCLLAFSLSQWNSAHGIATGHLRAPPLRVLCQSRVAPSPKILLALLFDPTKSLCRESLLDDSLSVQQQKRRLHGDSQSHRKDREIERQRDRERSAGNRNRQRNKVMEREGGGKKNDRETEREGRKWDQERKTKWLREW